MSDDLAASEEFTEMVRRRLEALLAVVQLEEDGQPVEIDSFRMRGPDERCGD